MLIEAIDAAGIAKAVAVWASTTYGHNNSYLIDALYAHPDRLTGMRLFTSGSTMPNQANSLDDGLPYAEVQPLWDFAANTGAHLKLILRNIEAAGEGASSVSAFLDHPLAIYSADRVAWGSNFPAADKPLGYIVKRARTALADLPEDTRAMIFAASGAITPLMLPLPKLSGSSDILSSFPPKVGSVSNWSSGFPFSSVPKM